MIKYEEISKSKPILQSIRCINEFYCSSPSLWTTKIGCKANEKQCLILMAITFESDL